MKSLFFFIAFVLIVNNLSLSQDATPCLDNYPDIQDTIPNYLQPWWNNVQIGLFAVVFVDFPDGRYINGNDTLQAIYDWQLEWVRDHGVLDAAGEMGLILEQTNIQVGNKFVKASKYNWYDRWNMFFSF